VRSLSILLAGTLAGQAIAFLLTLLLARVYTPEVFGEYTLFLATFGIVSGVATLSLDKAVLFASDEDRARFLTGAAILASVAVGALWCLGSWGVTVLSGHDASAAQAWAVGLAVAGYGAFQAQVQLRLYLGRSTSVAASKVTQGAAAGSAQLALHPWLGPGGLISGHVLGVYLAIAPLITGGGRPIWRLPGLSLRRSLASVRKESADYLLFVTPAQFIDALSNQLPAYVVAWLFLDATLGQYGMALRVLSAPAALVGVSIGQWYLQRSARELSGAPERLDLLTTTWRRLAGVGFVPFAVLMLVGDRIFAGVFGEPWRQAGEFAMILAPILYLKFISTPTSGIYYQLGLQRLQLAFTALMAVLRPAAMFVGGTLYGIRGGIMLMSLVEALQILAYNAIALRRLASSLPAPRS
jgi:O-antigen/teichoic acid export membrane protein